MKKFKEFKRFEHIILNSKYDDGAQNQMKKTNMRSLNLTPRGTTDHFANQS